MKQDTFKLQSTSIKSDLEDLVPNFSSVSLKKRLEKLRKNLKF